MKLLILILSKTCIYIKKNDIQQNSYTKSSYYRIIIKIYMIKQYESRRFLNLKIYKYYEI